MPCIITCEAFFINMATQKKRLDLIIQERYPDLTRNFIQSLIMQGKVFVDGKKIIKAGTSIENTADIILEMEQPKYVSRAGFKLEKALDYFNIDVTGYVALDAGLSTGGFTDCLLQRGAKKVYGVDVGYGQVHEKIRNDSRVIVMERTNLRHLEPLSEQVDIVTLDLSFISVLKVLDAIIPLLKNESKLVVLIKPQFEADRADVGRGGIIKDETVHQKVVDKVSSGIEAYGFECKGIIESPILGSSGNKEFLAYFVKK